jgi:hypothetical protein
MNPARAETARRDPPAWLPQRDEVPVQPEPQPITSNAMTVARLQAGAQPPPAAEGMQAQYGNAAVVRSQPARAAPASQGEGQPAKAAPQAGEKKAAAREAAPGKELPARSGDAGDAIKALAAAPPSGMVRGLAAARTQGTSRINELRQELADHPPTMERPSGLPRKPAPEEAGAPEGEEVKPEAPDQPPPAPPAAVAVAPPQPRAPLPAFWVDAGLLDQIPEEEPAHVAVMAMQLLNGVPATDESVDTSAGPRPTVTLDEDADPAQMAREERKQRAAGDTAWAGAQCEMAEDEGENDIFPTVPEESLTAQFAVGKSPSGARRRRAPLDSPEVAAAVDAAAAGDWAQQVAQARQGEAAAAQQKDQGEQARRAETAAQIAQAERDATESQQGSQLVAKAEVAAARAAWTGELAAADAAYTGKAKTLREDHQGRIDTEKKNADAESKRLLDNAEADAEAERKKKVEEAEKKKREAKKESGGFTGWLKRKAKALINAVRSAVNAIFDALRRAVKFIIDQAKKLAVWAIEQARRAIVGLIRAFGSLLMLAADVFLAAFPKARAKAKAWIRKGVKTAEDAVNAAADALKKTVCALLDALGAALDFVLELYQRAYNAILDVVEFFVVGLIEIIEGIIRLGESAAMVGDHFLGQVQEEGIGVDLTKPLPIEKPTADPPLATVAQGAVAAGTISASDAALYDRKTLAADDVEVDPVAQLDLHPDLVAKVLPEAAKGDYTFAENTAAGDQPAGVLGASLASQAGVGAQAGGATTEPGVPGPAQGAPANAIPTDPEEQLTYLESQEIPHTCGETKKEEPAKDDALPAHMRVYGPFTSGQRFRYMWGQIKKGISQWWSCNWGKVVAVFAVGALIALLLGILTGGAIFSAIPPLLQIVAALLVGVAVMRAASWVGDYLKLAWGGDLAGGAKALARGFAILLIELVFALLFNAGAVIKALKSGVMGTVKAAAGAAKSAVKTTLKAGAEFGHAAATAFKAGVKNSKLIIAGFRNGFGQGMRTIGQLTRELFGKLRFKGFFFRLRGRMLELWGRFNPEVKLGEQTLTLEQAEDALKAIAKAGEKMTPAMRAQADDIAKAVAKALADETSTLSKTLRRRVRQFFNQFKSQHVAENPVLAEVWKRAVQRLENGQYRKYFVNGKLIDNVPPQAMKEMYAAARGNMNRALEEVVEELEKGFKTQLKNRLTELPSNVQVHHLLYKSISPELALARENLVLALRKTGGSADELHDIFHLISAGGQGNRWKVLADELADVIKDLYKL